jgi:hypothetical protein
MMSGPPVGALCQGGRSCAPARSSGRERLDRKRIRDPGGALYDRAVVREDRGLAHAVLGPELDLPSSPPLD